MKKEEKKDLSPMYKQFLDLKKKHPDALLLFRCGDFYETYKDDAEKSAKILGITLTKSSTAIDEDGNTLSMAGFPYHALDTYLPKLIRNGCRVAICDQIEEKQQTTKRKVSEIIESSKSEENKEEDIENPFPDDLPETPITDETKNVTDESTHSCVTVTNEEQKVTQPILEVTQEKDNNLSEKTKETQEEKRTRRRVSLKEYEELESKLSSENEEKLQRLNDDYNNRVEELKKKFDEEVIRINESATKQILETVKLYFLFVYGKITQDELYQNISSSISKKEIIRIKKENAIPFTDEEFEEIVSNYIS